MFAMALFLLSVTLGGMTLFGFAGAALGGGAHGLDSIILSVLIFLTLATFVLGLKELYRPVPKKEGNLSPEQLAKSAKSQKRIKIVLISSVVFVVLMFVAVYGVGAILR